MIWELVGRFWQFIWRSDRAEEGIRAANTANVGFDRLAGKLMQRLDKAEERLDECDQDRDALRGEIVTLTQRVNDCEEDRADMRARLETLELRSQ